MPLYEYFCSDCNSSFEIIHSAHAEPETTCPSCQGTQFTRALPKSFSMQFQGSGFYCTDYAKTSFNEKKDSLETPAQKSEDATKAASHCHTSSCGCSKSPT